MSGKRIYSDSELIELFKDILTQYPNITQDAYDTLDLQNRPGRATLVRRFGSWDNAKELALTGVEEKIEEKNPQDLLATRNFLINQNERIRRELEKQRNLTQVFIENCVTSIYKLNIRSVTIPPRNKYPEEQEFHSIRCDAHVGEKTDPVLVQGLAEYNSKLYAERLNVWTNKVLLFKSQDEKSLGLNKLVISHLGDQVTGESIYKGQPFYLDLSLVDQLFFSVEQEASAMLSLASRFETIEFYAVCGNHGRPAGKGENHARTNFDYLFYRALSAALKQQENIKFYISEGPSMLVRHGNFKFLLNHGDSIKSWAGIPFYGQERMFQRLSDLYSVKVDYMLTAHFHQPLNIGDRIIMGGSFPGGSDLSINKLHTTNRPSQKIFYFDKEHGIHRETNLILAPPIRLQPDESGIYTAWVN